MNPTRRTFLTAGLGASALPTILTGQQRRRPPNVVLVFLDDSGYSDFRPFGKTEYPTPNVERLASQGCRFTNFYVPQAVCSASRSALMSGCYPGRTKVFGAHAPRARGLEPTFATMGEVLKKAGYRTAVYGKWHIGDQPETRPPARGFDESCGLMYSNDMWKHHPESRNFDKFPLQFWENGKIKIEDVTAQDQPHLTQWYTEHAVDFVRRNKANPFLLYVPHSMPHVPIFAGAKFKGKSGKGLYADVMMEIDWSVGEILKSVKAAGVENDTMVVMTSDNGPWHVYGNHAGKTPFREAKGTGFDGGIRSACIVKYPGQMKADTVSTRAFCSIDLMPTIAHMAGASLPQNPVDGKDVWDWMTGKAASNPQPYYAFSTNNVFEGVISGDGRWKLHVPHAYRTLVKAGNDGNPGKYRQEKIGEALYDMEADPNESTDVMSRNPEVAAKLKGFAEEHRKAFYS